MGATWKFPIHWPYESTFDVILKKNEFSSQIFSNVNIQVQSLSILTFNVVKVFQFPFVYQVIGNYSNVKKSMCFWAPIATRGTLGNNVFLSLLSALIFKFFMKPLALQPLAFKAFIAIKPRITLTFPCISISYSGEILTIELFIAWYSTFWSHFRVNMEQNVTKKWNIGP